MSLKGKQVVVTRATHQATKLVEMLQDKEAVPLIYPCIDIAPLKDYTKLDRALRQIKTYDWLILTSSNTVLAICRRIASLDIQIDWTGLKIATVGTSTANALHAQLGIKPDFVSEIQSATILAETLPINKQRRVFLPQSNIATMDTAKTLQRRGVEVTVVSAYENVIGHGGDDIPRYLQDNCVDAVIFTSGSTVEGFIRRIQPLTAYHLPAGCLGKSTAEIAERHGFINIIVPNRLTLTDMLKELEMYFAKMAHP